MNSSNDAPDKDSMMALEALLKIRSNSISESTTTQVTSQVVGCNDGQGNLSVFSVPNTTILNMAHHLIPMHVTTAQPRFGGPQFKANLGLGVTATTPSNVTQPLRMASFASSRKSTPPLKSEAPIEEEALVRQEKIAAALRSNPQRGRKRDDLSVHERLELTRTRNREHAKSTRIRKKARYQELVDKEVQYDELKKVTDLDEARIDAVGTFIACREKLLCASPSSDDYRKSLSNTLQDVSTFTFDVQGPQHGDVMIRMDMFENVMRCKVVKKFGKDAVSNLGYRVVGGDDAIAVGKLGIAIVELSVVTKDNRGNDITIMTALIRWKFALNSDKLTSMRWTTILDTLEQVPLGDLKSNESVKDLLGLQTCYPSVVSLDHSGNVEQQPRSPGEGPGMNI